MFYSKLKEKLQKCYRQKSYDHILLSTLVSQMSYEDLPDSVNTNLLEMYRLCEGQAAIWSIKAADFLNVTEDADVAAHITFTGEPLPDGMGRDCIVYDNAGHTKELKDWKNNPDVSVFFNNNIFSPDLSIGIYSDMLNETDTSMLTLIKDAKHSLIPIVRDEKQKKVLELVLNDLEKGIHSALVDDSILPSITGEENKTIQTLDITDPSLSDKIQYLAKCRDDIFRWFYSQNGMNSQGSSKMAQQTTDEVNQDSAASMIIPVIRLKAAQCGIDMYNEKKGANAKVSLSECWMNRQATLDKEFAETDVELEDEAPEVEEKENDEDGANNSEENND